MKQFCVVILLCLLGSCGKKSSTAPVIPPPTDTVVFAKGADVSWLTEMESSGIRFYNSSGVEQDCMLILKNKGMNAIRLRVWVNPTNGWCNTTDVVNKAKRAANLGMKVMIDFHLSDWWADPGQQNKPAWWSGSGFTGLKDSVYHHVFNVLTTLKTNGVTPDWVQIGNETNDGMLWEDGRASTHMSNFAQLVTSGYNATKTVNTRIQVIVHISNGFNNSLFRWIFDGLLANGASWDIIGMSIYPSAANWGTLNNQCFVNMNDMITRYGKPVMICEVGMPATDAAACRSFLNDLIAKTRSISNKKGLGVFYWEPECYNNWSGYSLGAFDNTGKPTVALDAFAN